MLSGSSAAAAASSKQQHQPLQTRHDTQHDAQYDTNPVTISNTDAAATSTLTTALPLHASGSARSWQHVSALHADTCRDTTCTAPYSMYVASTAPAYDPSSYYSREVWYSVGDGGAGRGRVAAHVSSQGAVSTTGVGARDGGSSSSGSGSGGGAAGATSGVTASSMLGKRQAAAEAREGLALAGSRRALQQETKQQQQEQKQQQQQEQQQELGHQADQDAAGGGGWWAVGGGWSQLTDAVMDDGGNGDAGADVAGGGSGAVQLPYGLSYGDDAVPTTTCLALVATGCYAPGSKTPCCTALAKQLRAVEFSIGGCDCCGTY